MKSPQELLYVLLVKLRENAIQFVEAVVFLLF